MRGEERQQRSMLTVMDALALSFSLRHHHQDPEIVTDYAPADPALRSVHATVAAAAQTVAAFEHTDPTFTTARSRWPRRNQH
jgi:hypothetical protein